ncbi:MAG TPA: hypothetical protein VGN00_07675 [Puia sp.]|jgi:hypothetical protein
MNKNANTWIEGNGTVRTVFRQLALSDYCTQERSRLQLIKAIEKKEHISGSQLLDYAIFRRKSEIQWVSVYLPGVGFSATVLFLFHAGFTSANPMYMWLTVGLSLALSLVFRITFFAQYLDACRAIYFAGDQLTKENTSKKDDQPATVVFPFIDIPSEHKESDVITNVSTALDDQVPTHLKAVL